MEHLSKHYKKGTLVLSEINFDHVFKRKVMLSGSVGKIYLPRELINQTVYVVVKLDGGEVKTDEAVKQVTV